MSQYRNPNHPAGKLYEQSSGFLRGAGTNRQLSGDSESSNPNVVLRVNVSPSAKASDLKVIGRNNQKGAR